MSNSSRPSGYEKKDASIRSLVVTVIASIVLITVMVVILYDYFIQSREGEIYDKLLAADSAELLELRARETHLLTTYELIDSTRGYYRIPIEQAMRSLAAEKSGTNRAQ